MISVGPATITEIGIVFAIAYVVCISVRARWLPAVLAAALPFSHTAMFIVAGNGVNPFWIGAIIAVARLILLSYRAKWRVFGRRFVWFGSNIALVLFLAYSLVVTFAGPFLFAGLPVISPDAGFDRQVESGLTPLAFGTSNLAQGVYVVLGVLLVIYLVVERNVSPRIVELAIVIGLGLALFKHLFPNIWPYAIFDNSPSVYYAFPAPGRRERGSFAEPSVLGMFLALSLAYLCSAIVRVSWPRRVFYTVLIAIGLYMYTVSYTGTALLSLGFTALVGLVVTASIFLRRSNRSQRIKAAVGALVAAIAVILLWPLISRFTVDIVIQKLTTTSFDNRGGSNAIAIDTFLQSFALGVGLGSSRPSSLFFMLLSCVGILGTVLFLRAVGGYTLSAWKDPNFRGISWSIFATLVAQVTAKPDLSAPSFWLLLGLCAIPYVRVANERRKKGRTDGALAGLVALPTFRKSRDPGSSASVASTFARS